MKKIIGVFLSWACFAYAVEIPFEEKLSISSLENGVELWLKQYTAPRQWISFRIVAKNPLEEVPQIIALDCPANTIEDELPCFISDCRESIRDAELCKIAIVAVGDFEKESLREFLKETCEIFSRPTRAQPGKMITLNPSPQSDMVYLTLSYPTSFQELKTDQDLKKLWVLYLLQSVVEERFRKTMKEIDGQWIQPAQAKYLLPYTQTIARGKQMLGKEPNSMLIAFLIAMHEFKGNGFTEQELMDAKAKLQKNLLTFYQKYSTNNTLAEYIASHAAFGAGCPDYTLFMRLSFSLISEIGRQDIAELMGGYFRDSTRRVDMKAPPQAEITEAAIKETLNAMRTDALVLDLDGNTPDNSSISTEELASYDKLPVTDAEVQIIYQIIDTVGTTNALFLAPKYFELKELGNKVQHVHPLKFLGVVLTNPHLKQCLINMEESNLKWKGFLSGSGKTPGFIAKCEREYARNNFAPYIVGFCQTVKAHPDQVRMLIEKKEWEKLARMLVKLEN